VGTVRRRAWKSKFGTDPTVESLPTAQRRESQNVHNEARSDVRWREAYLQGLWD